VRFSVLIPSYFMQAKNMKDEFDPIIAQAAQQHATGFPNPERLGCPPPGQITSRIWTGQLPDQQLRQHLLSCSECFNEYREQLAAYQVARQTAPTWWQRWKDSWPVRSALAFAAVLLVSLGGWFVWQQARTPLLPQIATNTNVAQSPIMPASSPSPETRAPIAKATEPESKPKIASQPAPTLTRAIDLNEYVALRDVKAGSTEEKPIHLASEPIRLQLNLPEGSTKGVYTVRLLDAFGRSLRRASVLSQTGKTLTVTLDLRSIKASNYRLELSWQKEAPDYYPVTVTEKHRK
jgi:hypothetical protein